MTSQYNDELTGTNQIDPEYQEWVNKINNASNDSVTQSRLIRDRILLSEEFSAEDRKLFLDVFEYVEKVISQKKQLEPNLLKIYLQDIKGYDIEDIKIIRILVLVALCGFTF